MKSETVALINADEQAKAETARASDTIAGFKQAMSVLVENGDYAKLAVMATTMVKLELERAKQATAQLERKLLSDVAELVDVYSIELGSYCELRVHLSDGQAKVVTLHERFAPMPASKPGTPTTAGAPQSKPLLDKWGAELNPKAWTAGGATFPAGVSFNELNKIAHEAPDKKNAVYKMLVHLRAYDSSHLVIDSERH